MRIVILSLMFTLLFVNLKADGLKSLPNNYKVVVGDNINVRSSSDINASIICKLKIATEVKLIKRSDIKYTNGEINGYWIYIDTGNSDPLENGQSLKGWVIDYYVVDLKQFSPLNSFMNSLIEAGAGDFGMKYQFFKDGTFKSTITDSYEGKKKNHKGKLYSYRSVIYAKNDSEDSGGFFYVKDNKVCCFICCSGDKDCYP